MTQQEIFDKMVSSVIKQGGPSIARGDCLYRTGQLKCAFGFLIPDDVYNSSMEGKKAWELIVTTDGLDMYRDHSMLIEGVQSAHDRAAFKKEFLTIFKVNCHLIAEQYGLVWNHGDI